MRRYDGGVSLNDFNVLAGKFGKAAGTAWVDGDFDNDGGLSINDFNLLAGTFGTSVPPGGQNLAGLIAFAAAHDDLAAFEAATGMPEPTHCCLLVGSAAMVCRRKRG